jgi:hypothetical protein
MIVVFNIPSTLCLNHQVFRDSSSTFDTVDYDILLTRLESSFGVVGDVKKYIKSYLSDRTCFVLVNGQCSRTVYLVGGRPQGAVLGPKFLLLCSKDLEELIADEGFDYRGYSDDTQVYGYCDASALSIARLAERFALWTGKVLYWMKVNRIQLNPNKTEYLRIHSTRCSVATFPDLSVGGNQQYSTVPTSECQYILMYTVGHKKTHQNVFYHNIHKTRPILKRFGGLLLI